MITNLSSYKRLYEKSSRSNAQRKHATMNSQNNLRFLTQIVQMMLIQNEREIERERERTTRISHSKLKKLQQVDGE